MKRTLVGTVIVHVEILDDRTQATVRFEDYEGATKAAIVALVTADLRTLVDAETDATLNAAYVDKLIATI